VTVEYGRAARGTVGGTSMRRDSAARSRSPECRIAAVRTGRARSGSYARVSRAADARGSDRARDGRGKLGREKQIARDTRAARAAAALNVGGKALMQSAPVPAATPADAPDFHKLRTCGLLPNEGSR
jgi:hypothetical protein